MKYITTYENHEYLIEIIDDHHLAIDGTLYPFDFQSMSENTVYSLLLDNQSYEALVYPSDELWNVLLRGSQYSFLVEDEREKRLRSSLGGNIAEKIDFHLKAPMPGLIVSIPVKEGQMVAKGDVLVVLESMKMQNELRSPRSGRVSRVRVNLGDSVEQRMTLLSVV